MIKIHKSVNVPPTLKTASTPTSSNDVKSSIYKAKDVREQLIKDQYQKCAYCETIISKQYNDVEHYRPKHDYHWLGYTWDNLLYSCDKCNRSYKKGYFPLKDEAARDLVHQDTSKEDPLIINPCEENPLNHIHYNRHIVCALEINGQKDAKGETCITLFHLNDREERPELVNAREQIYEQHMNNLRTIKLQETILQTPNLPPSIYVAAQETITNMVEAIAKMKRPESNFSGMLIGQK